MNKGSSQLQTYYPSKHTIRTHLIQLPQAHTHVHTWKAVERRTSGTRMLHKPHESNGVAYGRVPPTFISSCIHMHTYICCVHIHACTLCHFLSFLLLHNNEYYGELLYWEGEISLGSLRVLGQSLSWSTHIHTHKCTRSHTYCTMYTQWYDVWKIHSLTIIAKTQRSIPCHGQVSN